MVLPLGLKVKISVSILLHSGLVEPKLQFGFAGCFFVVYWPRDGIAVVVSAFVRSVAFEYSISQRISFDPGTQMKNFFVVGFDLTVVLGGKYVGGVAVGVGFGHLGSNTRPLQLNGSSSICEASVVKIMFENRFGSSVTEPYLTVANGDGGLNVKISRLPLNSSVTR